MTKRVSATLQKMWKERDNLNRDIKRREIKIKLLAESYIRDDNNKYWLAIKKTRVEMAQLTIVLNTLEDAIKIREEDDS